MKRKGGRTKAAHHRGSRKHYAVAVSREVHTILHAIARHTDQTPGAVLHEMLLREKK